MEAATPEIAAILRGLLRVPVSVRSTRTTYETDTADLDLVPARGEAQGIRYSVRPDASDAFARVVFGGEVPQDVAADLVGRIMDAVACSLATDQTERPASAGSMGSLVARYEAEWAGPTADIVAAFSLARQVPPGISLASAPILNAVPLTVTGVIGRTRLPLRDVSRMAPGDVVPFPGATVEAVDLELDGERLGRGELGADAGARCVRLARAEA